MTLQQPRFRITLWDRPVDNPFSGSQVAVVFDAKQIGIEEFANDSGSAYWTLDNDHPQISQFIPLTRRYEISRWSDPQSRWEFVAAGILNDYSSTDTQTTFSGLDYMAVLNTRLSSLDGYSSVSTWTAPLGQALTTTSPLDNASSTAYINSYDLQISNVLVSASRGLYANYSNLNNSNYDLYFSIPRIRIQATAIWLGATTSGFSNKMHWVIEAGDKNLVSADYYSPYELPIQGEPTVMAEVDLDQTSFTSTFDWTFYAVDSGIIPANSTEEYYAQGASGVYNGYGFNYVTQLNNTTYADYYGNPYGKAIGVANLYAGSPYKFRIYAAIQRTSTGVWYRVATPSVTPVAVSAINAVDTQTCVPIVQDLLTGSQYRARTLPHTLSVTGTTSTNVIDFRTAGQSLLDAIARVCDIQMGSRTDKAKTIFGIDKPSLQNTYTGNWEIKVNISSAATTAFALRYPDNITSFSYTPGASRVKTNIYIVGALGEGAGEDTQQITGTPFVSAEAIGASSATYGVIPQAIPISGYLPSSIATNEANRFAVASKPENTKGLSIRLSHDAVKLWDGWDVGDSVNVYISKGPVIINEPFVISGVRWFGDSSGAERIQLELVQASAFGARFGG